MAVSTDGKMKLDAKFFGEKSVIISKSGYGKSYTSRVIIEEGIEKGNTFIIVDPQDAYMNLDGFDYIRAENVKSVQGLGTLLSQTNKNVVVQTKRLTIDQQNKFMHVFLTYFRKHIRKGIQTIVIDEIHKYAPEQEKTEAKEIVRGMFQENRSDGLGCIAITQRISRLDKTILSQADHLCLGRVTSFRDKEAVKNYIDNPDDLEKICKLEKGEFYFYGFDTDEPEIHMIRKAKTKHSGDSPTNLLTENKQLYNSNIQRFVKKSKSGEKNMSDQIDNKDIVDNIIPSKDGFQDLAMLGSKVSLGGAIGGIVGSAVGARFASPLPVISSRTLGGMASTVTLYAGFRAVPQQTAKEVLKYACAGSAVYTLGSLTCDMLAAMKVSLPPMLNLGLSAATGVSTGSGSSASNGEDVDTNTAFA